MSYQPSVIVLVNSVIKEKISALSVIFPSENNDGAVNLTEIKRILDDFNAWSQEREQYVRFTRDYPFGWPSFDCTVPKTEPPAEDVHRLSPWHISVVGAIGDSLTAGRAAGAKSIKELQLDYRGLSFATGAERNLTNQATLANIFFYFSPHLIGYSNGTTSEDNLKATGFNLARSGMASGDLLRQAKELVDRIKSDRRVNFNKDWKFINIFIGSNDLCRICLNQTEFSAKKYAENVVKAIRYLRDNLPRSYVNILPPFNVEVLQDTHENPFCVDMHRSRCPCLFQLSGDELSNIKQSFDDQLDIFSAEEYQTKTFAVSISYGLNIAKLATLGTSLNLAYIALDCFHFSEISHDLAAKVLWSDLFKLGPSRVSVDLKDFQPQRWVCPPENFPYLKTVLNSKNFSLKTTQRILRQIERDETIYLPSMSELERRAFLEQYNLTLILFVIGVVMLVVGSCLIFYRGQRRYPPYLNERTHLLDEKWLKKQIF